MTKEDHQRLSKSYREDAQRHIAEAHRLTELAQKHLDLSKSEQPKQLIHTSPRINEK